MNDKDMHRVSNLEAQGYTYFEAVMQIENERKSKRRKIILLSINIFGLLLLLLLFLFIFYSTQLALEEKNSCVYSMQPEQYVSEFSCIIP